jgi:nicotinamide mononucleotide (NMN) deamidase PncC
VGGAYLGILVDAPGEGGVDASTTAKGVRYADLAVVGIEGHHRRPLLGVDPLTIAEHGAVSEATVSAVTHGVAVRPI